MHEETMGLIPSITKKKKIVADSSLTSQAEEGVSEIQGYPLIHMEFRANLK